MPAGITNPEKTIQQTSHIQRSGLKQLISNELWKKGPEWLTTETKEHLDQESMPEECISELKGKTGKTLHNLMVVESTTIGQLITCMDFSSAG